VSEPVILFVNKVLRILNMTDVNHPLVCRISAIHNVCDAQQTANLP